MCDEFHNNKFINKLIAFDYNNSKIDVSKTCAQSIFEFPFLIFDFKNN